MYIFTNIKNICIYIYISGLNIYIYKYIYVHIEIYLFVFAIILRYQDLKQVCWESWWANKGPGD